MRIKMALSVASILVTQNLLLANETTKLDDVQVVTSASGYEQKITDAPASISVISQEDLKKKKYSNLAEAIEDVEGVDVRDGVGKTGGLNISIRGMGSSNTLILIDGRRQNSSGNNTPNGFGETSGNFLPPLASIERIEVIKGAQSSIWGADASAGVINIVTKSAQDGTHGSAAIEYGRYNSKTAKANISHKNENFDAKFGAMIVDTDGFSAMTPKGEKAKKYEDDGYKNRNINLKLGYNFDEQNRVSTSYELIDTKTDIDGYDPITFANDPNNNDIARTKNHLANLTYENRNSIALTKVYTNFTEIKRSSTNSQTPDYKGITKEYGANTSIDYLSSSNVTIGADYKKFENKKDTVDDYDNKAVFVSNTNIPFSYIITCVLIFNII